MNHAIERRTLQEELNSLIVKGARTHLPAKGDLEPKHRGFSERAPVIAALLLPGRPSDLNHWSRTALLNHTVRRPRCFRPAVYSDQFRSLLLELFLETKEAIRRIERRFSGIQSPEDFLQNEAGIDRLDAIAVMLIAIGENVQRIGKLVGQDFFDRYPEINWAGVAGIRNLLAHDYFNIDAEEVYFICVQDIEPLKQAIQRIRGSIL